MSTTPGIKLTCTAEGCEGRTVARRLCRAHYQAAWKAGKLGAHEKQPPRTKAPKICPPDHKHADSLVCYNLHQCRCSACSQHRMQTEERRRKDKAYGRYDTGLVDVAPVREHMLKLGEFGIGYKRVAELAGFKSSTPVRTIIWGRQEPGPRYGELQKRVKRETAEKILAIRPTVENLSAGQSMPSRGAHRRVQALVARGWSLSKIAHRIGMTGTNFSSLMQRPRISVAHFRAIAAIYEELWDQLPPREEWRDKIAYSRSLKFAQQRRWLPPLAWDDIDLDSEPPVPDEEVGVDETAVELAIAGEHVRLRPAERREIVTRLHPLKWSDGRIAETIRCNAKTISRIREELGLEAWEQNELRDRGAA